MNAISNLLEIHPHFACWFECFDTTGFKEIGIRKEKMLGTGCYSPEQETACRCHLLKGEPWWFNLKPNTFDIIGCSADVSFLGRLLLERKRRVWSTKGCIFGVFGPNVSGFAEAFSFNEDKITWREGAFHPIRGGVDTGLKHPLGNEDILREC